MTELFREGKTLEELCSEFKAKAVEWYESHKEKEMIVDLSDIERFFSFVSANYQSTWIPKDVRDILRTKGVKLRKQRARTYVIVELD